MTKIPFAAWAIIKAFGTSKIDSFQNQDLSTSIERPHKELLNALLNFEILHSKLKLWAVNKISPGVSHM